MSDIATDCILATVGIMPTAITARDIAASVRVPAEFRKRALAWWNIEDRPAFKEPQVKDLDGKFTELSTPIAQPMVKQWLESAGDDVDKAADVHAAVEKARAYLVEKWPRIQIPTFAGTQLAPLSIDDEAEMTALFTTLNDPVTLLDDMDAGSLSPSQAEAFRANYPSLYEQYRNDLHDGAAAYLAKHPEWIPDEAQEIILAILTGQPSGVESYEATTPAAEAPQQEKDLGASDAETQADKTSKPRSAHKG